ncbi:hypothetical protein EYZ11_003503 [Aspergillus tanneri]|uniref:Alginate lyase domain-containing protein n=1 Tax=Aspergillus tanneri TaxID=1220188 RepID=A0A4S3JMY1_9EURO|nr:hypothetical protein EYZ11_003503 [Aspergillus tanneri]
MAFPNSPQLQRFHQAQESVFGDFTTIDDPNRWTPPPWAGGHRGRYLWTDAFGVINFITLHREYEQAMRSSISGTASAAPDDRYLILARRLVETVHSILGRTRDGQDLLPGATEENPLGGGLRIGKKEATGPDGDGQYHHYLTLWMFALNRLSLATGDPKYNRQAVALARAIHAPFFVNRHTGRPRMVWKMAMDLSKPLVASEGNLDPVDGYVVCRLLQAAAMQSGEGAVLKDEMEDYRRVMRRKGVNWLSRDPLDLGMTLWTVHWFVDRESWATQLAVQCLDRITDLVEIERYFERNRSSRLAFREFGTCMGLKCISEQLSDKEASVDYRSLADSILHGWEAYLEQSLMSDDLRPINKVIPGIPTTFLQGMTRRGRI